MEVRIGRGRTRLIEKEESLARERETKKKLGMVLPEEAIRIPKIGEWALNETTQPEPAPVPPPAIITGMRPVRPFPRDLPLNTSQRKRISKVAEPVIARPRARSDFAVVKVHARNPQPVTKVVDDGEPPETRVAFPAGTATTNLNDILRSKFLDPQRPLPVGQDVLNFDPKFFPLEVFDNGYNEEFSINELMKDPIGFSKYSDVGGGEPTWERCKVIGYDESTKLFLIEWVKTGKRKKVARFNIRFEREDETKFKERIAGAKRACMLSEAAIRFATRVDQMPTDALPILSDRDFDMIHRKMRIPKDLEKLSPLDDEIRTEFARVNNSMEFEWEIEHNPLIPGRAEFLELKVHKKERTDYGLVEPVNINFWQRVQRFSDMYLFANPHIQKGVFTIWSIFQDAGSVLFLLDGFPRLLSLDDFIEEELKHLHATTKEFKSSIQDTLENVVALTVSGQISSIEPKEKRRHTLMVTLTTRMLHTILRDIIDNTLKAFIHLFGKYNDEDEGRRLEPQFEIDMLLSAEGILDFSPPLEQFQERSLALLNEMEIVCAKLPLIKSAFFEVNTTSVSFHDCTHLIRNEATTLDNVLNELFLGAKTFLSDNRFLEQVLSLDPDSYTHDFDPSGQKGLDEYRQQINEFNRILDIVQNKMQAYYTIGAFKISAIEFKKMGAEHIQEMIKNFLSQVKLFALEAIAELQGEFDKIAERLQQIPNSPEELAETKKYLANVYNTIQDRAKRMEAANERFTFLEEYQFTVSNEECEARYRALQMPQKVSMLSDENERTLSVERIRMIRELRGNQRDMENETLEVTEALTSLTNKYVDLEMAIDAYEQVNELHEKLQKLKKKQELYAEHEKIFDFEPSPCKILVKLSEDFAPLYNMWSLAYRWIETNAKWLETSFPQVKADAMNAFLAASGKTIVKLKKDMVGQVTLVEKVLLPLSQQIDQFKQGMPLITRLRNPGIKTKHWEMISKVVGFEVLPSSDMSLQDFLALDLGRWSDKISEIAGVAAQEYQLEASLDQMDSDLQSMNFVTVEFRDSGRFILHEVDEVISTIDDQLVTSQTLLTSPFIGPVKKRALEKLAFLKVCRDILESWTECQRSWLYLQPIFSGTSIQQKLHKEAREWMQVDTIWSGTMTLTHNHPEFNSVMHRDNLGANLEQCNILLDSITKGLNAYLEAKRLGFPRFFFLSNDELISILSHTKDFNKIQESMQKLFEYVNSITVDEQMMISAMNDAEGESVTFLTEVNGDTPEIEDWLSAFEEEMKNTLKESTANCMQMTQQRKKEEWISEFPAQVVLMANQIIWTEQVTQSVTQYRLRGLKTLQTKYLQQLDQLTAMVRQPIDRLLRQVLSSLLINEVHNRDIINGLVQAEMTDIDTFKWIQQLRYYWEDDTIMLRSINNAFEYSYEYAGNSARLVITPLTDRCYQTLLAAFKQTLGGAPSGPAGTGKTETTRDCAKALGRPCVVYNCSEEVTPEQMSQFFAGLSSSGSWSCFDEFNRINIEVLSVIAQQVRCIQEAIAAKVPTFNLDQRTLKVSANAAIIITMNPGYAGRTELPDNLKALFRPCAMMVPDFAFIAEIMLFSGGFTTASMLSIKLVALFDLCRKQLSNAHHYDWGLRAMKAILSTAGKAKRNDLEANESLLLVQTIRDCTSPKLVSSDLPLFAGIIKDVFPDVTADKTQPEQLVSFVTKSFEADRLQPLPVYVSKCVEYYETTVVRHGIMLIGGTLGGKSTSWKMLAKALTIQAQEASVGKPVHVESLNPKAITIGELYGAFNPTTSEWADGVLSKSIRECSFSEQTELKWIIVDGPVDALWIESMNSLLDDNKVLCLPNNERIQLGPHVKMVFEVDDLGQASPATVSRCGMVYFDPGILPWAALADSWMNQNDGDRAAVSGYVRGLMNGYIPKLLQFVEADSETSIAISPNCLMVNFLRLVDCYFDIMRRPEEKIIDGDERVVVDPLEQKLYMSKFGCACPEKVPYYEPETISVAFERAVVFAMVWAFGGALVESSRGMFDKFFRELVGANEARCEFPPRLTVFDYYADLSTNGWTPWCDGATGMGFTESKRLEEQMIPTNESASVLFLSRLLVSHQKHVLIQGPESSKTLVGKTLIEDVLDKKSFDCHPLPLANCSTPTNISSYIQSFLHKRHGHWGPLPNHHAVFLLDNIGSVKPEVYGAQPALELLRQFMDFGGWFNTSPVEFMNIVGTTIVSTMGVPGGGLFTVPERLSRHFFVLHMPKYSLPTISSIVNLLMSQRFIRFQLPVREMMKSAAAGTITVFEQCQQNLLAIPSKLHYVFNLRSIVRVIKGMLLVSPAVVTNDSQLIKLWYHEMMREFYDKFNSQQDREWFRKTMNDSVSSNFKVTWESVCKDGFLMFNEFSDGAQSYKEVTLPQEQVLTNSIGTLDDYNREATKPIDIVLFHEAIEHLSALSRVFAEQRGHALLVGVKSSGRKSLARLALHMGSIDTFEIAITRTYGFVEWREDIKNLLKQCGKDDLPTGFIITDVQIIMNRQLEDLSNLLINCEIPQLFARDEFEAIKAELAQMEMRTDVDYGELFMERVRQNLHIILVFSPYGNIFRESMLSYPALRSETTIDWFMPWSQNALESVASASLTKGEVGSPETVKSIVTVCVQMHKSVEEMSDKFLKETKRFTACTPSRYFELLMMFQSKLRLKTQENLDLIQKYENGVEKIKATSVQIKSMSEQLDIDIPILKKTRGEVEKMLEDLKVKQGEVEETRKEVQGKSEIAEHEAMEAGEASRLAQEQLDLAQPILDEAQKAVQQLDKDALVNIKKLHQPSAGMKETFDAVCIMFGRNPRKVDGASPGEKIDDYWPEAVSLLNDIQFIKNVTNFKIEAMTKNIIEKLKKYVPQKKEIRMEKRKAALASFAAVAGLYDWVCASFDYWFVYQEILPKKIAAENAAKQKAASEAILAAAQEHLAVIEAKLQSLEDNVTAMQDREHELTANVGRTQSRLTRAQKIMDGLSGETTRWTENAAQLRDSAQYILGDSILIAGVLTYLAAYSPSYRNSLLESWKDYLVKQNIKFDNSFTIEKTLGNEGVIRDWIVKGLPNDTHSIENALIITQNDQCFPLLIDPQLSGTKWLRAVEGEKLVLLRFDQADFLQRLKSCVSFGIPVLLENVGLKMDPLIEPILSREVMIVDGQRRVALGGEYVPYSDQFKLYISTKYPNPHYSPEICSQVILINFTTTQDGLTDLLLNSLIEVEREDLDKKRIQLMEDSAENTKKIKEIEQEILQIVSNAGSDILDDDAAIDTLQRAQKTSANIEQQMVASEKTEKQISEFKEKFSVVSQRAALLYFCVADFAVIDPMYQFSLKWFVSLFRNALQRAEHPAEHSEMVAAFHSCIAKTFYESVSFSLFSRHKLLFSALMVFRTMLSEQKIGGSELAFLLAPKIGSTEGCPSYIAEDVWQLVVELKSAASVFDGLAEHIQSHEAEWMAYATATLPETETIPYDKELSSFQKFLLLRVFHLQRVREGLHIFISHNLGEEFVKPPTLNLTNVFRDSDPLCPLIFIIMPGIDPQDEVIGVACAMETDKYLRSYSLGRGRGQGAEELILDASEKGFWVLLQNCHLSLSWMPRLEYIINNLDPLKTHPRFRLCLVTMSSPDFPIGILYQGTKLIYEIPKGMRENVMRIYGTINPDDYDLMGSMVEKQLTFHLAFFHAVVLERLQFGSIGWNIPYEFNPSDFSISRKHLRMFLSETSDDVPFEALSYVIGELNYGGRVTERWDRRLLLSILGKYFSHNINSSDFSFGERYKPPAFADDNHETLMSTVATWPVVTAGEDVGLSKNASTITARNEALRIFGSLVEVQPTLVAVSDSISEEQFALELVDSLIQRVPKPFNIHNFKKRFDLEDTINTVLHHEVILYNKLIRVISESLVLMQNGLKGLILIDEKLDLLNRRLLAGRVPEMWLEHSFPSILSLRSYMDDLNMRVEFLDGWIRVETPTRFKLGAFYHPEEFLTAVLQVYARKHVVPFDTLSWITTPLTETPNGAPEEGIYVECLPIEGAKWDLKEGTLIECGAMELISSLPLMHLTPTQDKAYYDMVVTYECPVFRTQNRGSGAMGLPNYIFSFFLPSKKEKPEFWVQRSVAAFITTQ